MERQLTDRVDKYTLLTSDTQSGLISTVNAYMMQGWRPEGAPLITEDQEGEACLTQAMVHNEGDSGHYLKSSL